MKLPFLWVVIVLILLLSFAWETRSLATSTPMVNLETLRWLDLPPIQTSAFYQVDTGLSEQVGYSLDKQIQVGDRLTDIFTLGDMAATGIADLSPIQIASLAQLDLQDIALSAFTHFTQQSLGSLVEALPALAKLRLDEIPSLTDLVRSQIGEGVQDLLSENLGALVSNAAIARLPLSQIPNLQTFSVADIPSLAETSLKAFTGWQGIHLKDIPGLDLIPLADLGILSPSAIASLDLVWGAAESQATFQPISGSTTVGFRYPCQQERCAYIELSGQGRQGDRWIKGGDPETGGQMVPGGSGLLGKAFGGMEPTGRMLGSEFKLILMNTDEAMGTAEFGLSTRFCQKGLLDLGCTPFIFGPWSLFHAQEKDGIFLGFDDQQPLPKPQVNVPASVQAQLQAAQAQYGDPIAPNDNDCLQKMLQKVPPTQRFGVTARLPSLLEQAETLNLTESQTAYAIAYLLTHPSGSMANILPQLKQFITTTKVDFFGVGTALGISAENTITLAHRASDYQAVLKDCFFGGSCGGGKMQRPSKGVVTSEMGNRLHPIYGTWRLHAGIDLSAGMGASILAADCGTATYVGWESGYGNVVILRHQNNLFTRYAHMTTQKISQNQTVKKGQLIGLEGSTGNSTGAHLHFEVRDGDRFGTPFNPRNYVNF
ncbi:M23 family metallopeptidase [Synechococcus moorigangaii CMS01]|nr:M23 family metallopeptidase [Synechococcus moorigangaii CMS01]